MTVVSTKEFNVNQEKYFDMAINEEVCIKKGNRMFHLMYRPVEVQYPEQAVLEPDDDLRNAISMDELLEKVKKHIHQLYAKEK